MLVAFFMPKIRQTFQNINHVPNIYTPSENTGRQKSVCLSVFIPKRSEYRRTDKPSFKKYLATRVAEGSCQHYDNKERKHHAQTGQRKQQRDNEWRKHDEKPEYGGHGWQTGTRKSPYKQNHNVA